MSLNGNRAKGLGRGRSSPPFLSSGVTLTELVLIMILVAILSLFILPRLFDLTDFGAHGYFDSLDAALGYARKEAITSECPVQVSLASGGYALAQASQCTNGSYSIPVVNAATGHPYATTLPSGVAQSTNPATSSIVFDATGSTPATETVTVSGVDFQECSPCTPEPGL
ncbi:general secretion pathway protein H [mine drainage metagenome]|uniref:General secretion pathway protein H n=1 Tax=mine drainage metagenome TaxID=410659 RepID=T1B9D8_9ZZZZ